jgi:hypothetical protein
MPRACRSIVAPSGVQERGGGDVARAQVRGLNALPAGSRSEEARVLAARTAKAALAFHPQWRDEAHSDCALAGSLATLTLLEGGGLCVAELQRQVAELV